MGRIWHNYVDGATPGEWAANTMPGGLSSMNAAFINQFIGWQRYICFIMGISAPIDTYFSKRPEQGQADQNGKKWAYPGLTNIQDRLLYNNLRFSPEGSNWLTNWRQDSAVGSIVEDWFDSQDDFPEVPEVMAGDIVQPPYLDDWFLEMRTFIDSLRAMSVNVTWPTITLNRWHIWENFIGSNPSGSVWDQITYVSPYVQDRIRWDYPGYPRSTEGVRPLEIIVPPFTPFLSVMRTVLVSYSGAGTPTWYNNGVHLPPFGDCYVEAETIDPIGAEGWDVTGVLPDYTPQLGGPADLEEPGTLDWQYYLRYAVVSVMPDSLPDNFKPQW